MPRDAGVCNLAGSRNWTVHPGETLAELLQERGLTQADLVRATGFTAKHINQVIKGHAGIGPAFALALEVALEAPRAEMWCALQTTYELDLLRIGSTVKVED